jgi:hypothetical protein
MRIRPGLLQSPHDEVATAMHPYSHCLIQYRWMRPRLIQFLMIVMRRNAALPNAVP